MAYLPTITTPYLKTYTVNNCNEKIDEIDKKVNNLSQDVIQNTTNISSLNNKINKVEYDVNKKINELNRKITNNANEILTINNKITNIDSINKIITDKVNEHESRIRTLESYSNNGSIFYDGNIFKKVDEEGNVNQIQQDGVIEQIHYDYYLYNECYDYKIYHGKTTGSRFYVVITHDVHCIVIPHIVFGEYYVGPKDATQYSVMSFQLPSFISILRINYLTVYRLNALSTVWNYCTLSNYTTIGRFLHTGGSIIDPDYKDKIEHDYYILPE